MMVMKMAVPKDNKFTMEMHYQSFNFNGDEGSVECPECYQFINEGQGHSYDCPFLYREEEGKIMQHPLNELAARVHVANKKWWEDLETGKPITRNVGELLALCHSELSEALEGHRKSLQDDKLPHRSMFEVELADCVIRIMDIAAGMGLDLGGAFEEKMAYNSKRHDHTREGRLAAGGKKY